MALPELFKGAFMVIFFSGVRVPARQPTSLSITFTHSVCFPQSLKTQKESFLESNEDMKIRYIIYGVQSPHQTHRLSSPLQSV